MAWNTFKSWSQSTKYFFLYTNDLKTAGRVPTRAFDEESMKLFLAALENIGRDRQSATE